MTREAPTLPLCSSTPFGEMKIPDPEESDVKSFGDFRGIELALPTAFIFSISNVQDQIDAVVVVNFKNVKIH